MSVLAQYSERRHEGRRDFALYSDRIEIRGKEYLGAEYEMTIVLKTLTPEIDRWRGRNKSCTAGFWLFFGSVIVAFILMRGFDHPAIGGATGPLWALALCGAFMLLATWRRETYAIFKADSGVAALSIAKEGRQREQFEDFVSLVQRQIRAARNSEPSAPPNGGPAASVDNSKAPGGPPSLS
jgi:hypothetical protein